MSKARFMLSAFGDEIASDLEEQLTVLSRLGVDGLDLRGAWDTNVLNMTGDQVRQVKQLCADHGITVRCIGSPIGKSPLDDPIENELANLDRILDVADRLNTSNIRLFAFYPADTSTNTHYDQHVAQAAERMARLAEKAQAADCILQLENEKDVVNDTPERNLAILKAVNSPALRFIWDPANFVQVGVADQVDRYWNALAPYIGYIHIKDALLADGAVRPAGEGDGQVKQLLQKLSDSGYAGVLSLEPHLKFAGHSSGFSGPDYMEIAVNALRKLLDEID